MISKKNFRDALISAGAKQVSPAALNQFEHWMQRFLEMEAAKAVVRMNADRRLRVEPADIGEK